MAIRHRWAKAHPADTVFPDGMGWDCGPGHRAGMPNYRRQRVAGGRYFFTVALQDRSSSLLIDRIADLRQAFRSVRSTRPFKIDALVVLPEHLHCVWTLPDNDADSSTRWSYIKSAFSRRIEHGEQRSTSRCSKRERGIWQRRFWEHAIRDDEDLRPTSITSISIP